MFKGESFASTQASGISEGLAAAFPFVLFFRYGFAPVGRTAQGRTITAELADPSSGACAQARFSREGPRGRRGRRRTGSRKRRRFFRPVGITGWILQFAGVAGEKENGRPGFDPAGGVAYTEYSSCRENSRLSRLFRKSVCVWVIGVEWSFASAGAAPSRAGKGPEQVG